MTFLMPPHRRARPIALALVAGTACWSTAALAQSSPATATSQPASPAATAPDTVRLTDEQREAILNASTEESAAAARGEPIGSEKPGRRIHGEMGFMIGSHGTRGVYGTADIPLGDNAGATISFENSRYGYRNYNGDRFVDPRRREELR